MDLSIPRVLRRLFERDHKLLGLPSQKAYASILQTFRQQSVHAPVKANPGPMFEQWVGIELWNRLQYLGNGRLFHQRSRDGAEVDFIIEHSNRLTPIEVKWTEHPTLSDARHLLAFLREKPKEAKDGYVICRCPRPLQLHERITALPWFCL